MVKGSGIVADADGGGAFLEVMFQVDCTAGPVSAVMHRAARRGAPMMRFGPPPYAALARSTGAGSEWTLHSCGVGYLDATGRWVSVPIKSVDVGVLLNGATGAAWFVVIQLKQYDAGPGVVTLMFLDGRLVGLDTARRLHSKHYGVGPSGHFGMS